MRFVESVVVVALATATVCACAGWDVVGGCPRAIGIGSGESMEVFWLAADLRGSPWLMATRFVSGGMGGAGGTKPQAESRQAAAMAAAKRGACMGGKLQWDGCDLTQEGGQYERARRRSTETSSEGQAKSV